MEKILFEIIGNSPKDDLKKEENFHYLLEAFPHADIRYINIESNPSVKSIFSLLRKGLTADYMIFIPSESLFLAVDVIKSMIGLLKNRTHPIYYDSKNSYPQYSYGGIKDACLACTKEQVTEIDLNELRRIAWNAWRGHVETKVQYEVLKGDLSLMNATYKRYIETNALPLTILIEPTNGCNFKCRMCPYHGESQKSDSSYVPDENTIAMDYSTFNLLVEQIHDLDTEDILLVPQLRGEPLAHPNIIDMIKTAKKYKEIRISFSTNGFFLKDKLAKEIIEQQADEVVVSLHAYRSSTAKLIGISTDIEEVATNIRNFVKLKKDLGSDKPKLYLKFVEMKENKEEFYEYMKRWVSSEITVGICKEDYFHKDNFSIRYNELYDFPGVNNKLRYTCFIPAWILPIYSDGSVRICPDTIDESLIIGNIHHHSLKSIILSEKRKSFLLHCNSIDELPNTCKGCEGWTSHTKVEGMLHGQKMFGTTAMVYFSMP